MEDRDILTEAVQKINKSASVKQAKVIQNLKIGACVEMTRNGYSELGIVTKVANLGDSTNPNWAVSYKKIDGKVASWKQADGGMIKEAGLWKNLLVTLGILGGIAGITVQVDKVNQNNIQEMQQKVQHGVEQKAQGLVQKYRSATPEQKQQIRQQAQADLEKAQEGLKSVPQNPYQPGTVQNDQQQKLISNVISMQQETIDVLNHALSQMK